MKVTDMRLPVDDLITKSYRIDTSKYHKFHKFLPFTSRVTLNLVKEEASAARKYVLQLLQEKEQYGYLYFLNTKPLLVPLNLQFNPELVVDPEQYDEIVAEIDRLAKMFACPPSTLFEITRIELLYFFTLLVNEKLTWIAVDHLIRGNKSHDYLLSSPERLIKKM